MKKYIEKLHFITHDIPQHSHIEQVDIACQAGAKWIQYRCFTKSDDELLTDINSIAAICDDWGATLIVTEHVQLKGKADIQGFHIENMDSDFINIRHQLGEEFTLGASANTLENLIRLVAEGADYLSYGPFAISTSNANNAQRIKLADYEKSVAHLTSKQIKVPILAIGGIKLDDVNALLKTGIYGIVVSSAINQAENMSYAYQDFYDAVIR